MLAARVVVLLALVVAHLFHSQQGTEGLLGWDARWYRNIADRGYGGVPAEGIRFFPLLPLLGRLLSAVLPGGSGVAILLLANGSAAAYAVLAQRLAVREGLGQEAARAVPWVLALAPAGFVLVMGYTEALYGVLICGVLLACRSRRWATAMFCGFLGALLRPTGIVLCVPIALEALADWRRGRLTSPKHEPPPVGVRSAPVMRCVAPFGPLLGSLPFLAWCQGTRGDILAPFRAQTAPTLRGGVAVNPIATLRSAVSALFSGHIREAAPLLHAAWFLVAAALLIVCARLLPLSYTAFAACTLALAVTSRGLSSFERYAAAAVPLLLAASTLLTTPKRRSVALVCGFAVMSAYTLVSFRHGYVP
jgi:hypothetical protein